MKAKKRNYVFLSLIILSVIAVLLLLAMISQIFLIDKTKSMLSADKINGIDISGKTIKEASANLLSLYEEKAKNFELNLSYNEKKWTLTNSDFIISSNIHTILDNYQRINRNSGSHEKQLSYINDSINNGNSIEIAFNHIFVGLDEKINNIIKEIEKPAIDCEIKFNPDNSNPFEILPSETGIAVDKNLLYKKINEEFKTKENINIEIPTMVLEPEFKEKDAIEQTSKIASFKTDVSDSTGGRKSNVKLALSKFNGLIVLPDEEVSFNSITAPHTQANGYKIATIIVNGRFVDGVGGGICQASTTLYNALLQTGVEILEVNKHTLPVRYVPLALDAMVSVGISDLRFKNTTNYPLYFKTGYDENSVSVEIFSHELENSITYKTRSETIKELPALGDIIQKDDKKEYTDKVLFEGEYYRLSYPRGGYEAKAYLQTYKDGKLLKEEIIRHEIYKPQHGLIIEGAEIAPENLKPIDNDLDIKTTESYSQSIIISGENHTVPTIFCP